MRSSSRCNAEFVVLGTVVVVKATTVVVLIFELEVVLLTVSTDHMTCILLL